MPLPTPKRKGFPKPIPRYLILFILSLFLMVGLFSDLGTGKVIARETESRVRMEVAQESNSRQEYATRVAAQKLFDEGMELFEQGTAESLQQAIGKWEDALPLYRELGDRYWQSFTLTWIGSIYDDLGEKQKSLNYYNQALPLIQSLGDPVGEAAILNNIGKLYIELGQKQKALDYLNQALPLFQAVNDKAYEASTLNNIGAIYDDLGEKQKALNYSNQAILLFQAVDDKAGEASALNSIAAVYSDLGEEQRAIDYYNQALSLRRSTKDKGGEAVTLNNIGRIYNDLGENQRAIDYFNQSLLLSRIVGNKRQEAITLFSIADLERDRKNLTQSLTQINAAIDIIENLRTKIDSQQLRTSYFATVQDYYQFKIDLLMELHQQNPKQRYDAQALETSEQSRARNLLEILTESHTNIRGNVDPTLRQEELQLTNQINALEYQKYQQYNSPSGLSNSRKLEIDKQIETLLTQLDGVKTQIRQKSPAYAAITQPKAFTLNLEQIQEKVLDENTILLEYALGKDRSYLWAVSKNDFSSYTLPPEKEIEAVADIFKAPSQLKDKDVIASEAAQKLSLMLLAPVADKLGDKRLLIVSNGVLQLVPFAALPIPERILEKSGVNKQNIRAKHSEHHLWYLPTIDRPNARLRHASLTPLPNNHHNFHLLDIASTNQQFIPLLTQHQIITLPSASTIPVLRNQIQGRTPAPKTLAVLADPVFTPEDPRFQTTPPSNNPQTDANAVTRAACTSIDRLPFTEKEATQILALIPDNQEFQALGFDASLTTATSPNLSQYQIVHLATHGCVNSEHPELSGVVLSLLDRNATTQDGFLRLNDIFNLNLPAELVVLSACQTGVVGLV
ncbi:MAG TPA: hypothetical protein DD000_05125, partial [Cyanobacteria bacterium UBA11166]|nr:hypothetical protein [Cyanobacteria bacterium UBA11166]